MYDGVNFSSSFELINKLRTYIPKLGIDEENLERAYIFVVKSHPKEFGDKLRLYRKKNGYSQLAFSNALNIGQTTYSTWETGVHSPKLANIKKIVSLLNLDPAELIAANEPKDGTANCVPILTAPFFRQLMPSDLDRALELASGLTYTRVPTGEIYDFAFRQSSTDMMGDECAIPPGALALCESWCLKDCVTYEQRFKAADTRLAVVSFMGNAMIREVHFVGGVLHLLAWNPKCEPMAFPMDAEVAKKMQPGEATKYLGFETFAQNVLLFGVIDKYIFDFRM